MSLWIEGEDKGKPVVKENNNGIVIELYGLNPCELD